jgi:molybdopterin molybdotransferase
VLSGGVSEGDRDLVPRILTQAGVNCVFHKVQLRPGKPLWFGVRRDAAGRTLVFGLPGNPVSGLVCCRLFVIPALHALAGRLAAWDGDARMANLSNEFVLRGGRPTYWPGRRGSSHQDVTALDWLGSADPFALARSDCLIFFAEGNRTYAAGERVPVISLDG